jgi:lysophospholipase L1-like esterase
MSLYPLLVPTILCFGDSNTWGAVPGSDTGRFARDVRWPGAMAEILGDDYEVCENGLNGRTTVFDRLPRPWRNGRDLIVPAMEVCAPIDLVVILLGTNDVSMPQLTVPDIVRGAGELVTIVRSSWDFGPTPGVAPTPLLVAPHLVGPLDEEDQRLSPGARERSVELVGAYRVLASTLQCPFFDLSTVVTPSEVDPWHWDADQHALAARALAEKVRELLG